MRKKAIMLISVTGPIIIVLLIILGIAVLFLAKSLGMTITLNNIQERTNSGLYTMLNSNDCTPKTNMLFKDVLAVGISQGKKFSSDTVDLNYGGVTESVLISSCLAKLRGSTIPATLNAFYVEYETCPAQRCFADEFRPDGMAKVPFKVESTEYIVLPGGDVAKAVLKMGA